MKSAKQYIIDEDFEGAFERFSNATQRWKSYWFDVCYQIANSCKEFLRKFNFNFLTKEITQKVRSRVKNKYNIITEVDTLDNAKQKCYLFEFYNSNDELVCSKVGTTIRKVEQRLKEEMRSKTYKELGCTKAIIKRVYNCGEKPAEGAESYLRAHYIKKYPNSFKKNDRFMLQYFDFDECDRLMESYLV